MSDQDYEWHTAPFLKDTFTHLKIYKIAVLLTFDAEELKYSVPKLRIPENRHGTANRTANRTVEWRTVNRTVYRRTVDRTTVNSIEKESKQKDSREDDKQKDSKQDSKQNDSRQKDSKQDSIQKDSRQDGEQNDSRQKDSKQDGKQTDNDRGHSESVSMYSLPLNCRYGGYETENTMWPVCQLTLYHEDRSVRAHCYTCARCCFLNPFPKINSRKGQGVVFSGKQRWITNGLHVQHFSSSLCLFKQASCSAKHDAKANRA